MSFLDAGGDIEPDDPVIFVLCLLGMQIAGTLTGHRMQQHRSFAVAPELPQRLQQAFQIMPVDRPVIGKAHLFEKADRLARRRTRIPAGHLADWSGELRQMGGQRPCRWRNRHGIIVQNDEDAPAQCTGIVDRLESHACRHRAIADDADHIADIGAKIARHGKAEPGRDRGGGMGRAECVMDTFLAPCEAGRAILLPQAAHLVAPPCQNLVRIALVADIPDELVMRRIENRVDGDGKFNDTETGAEMASRLGDDAERFRPQFVSQLHQVVVMQAAKVRRIP